MATPAAPAASAPAQSVAPAVTPNGAVTAATPTAQLDPATAAKQHQACLDVAKDNPSVTCK